jgi:hypothetical protein
MPKMSERQLKALQEFPTSKLNTRVRFPSPAPTIPIAYISLRFHSDKHAVAHSDKCPTFVRRALPFLVPVDIRFVVRLRGFANTFKQMRCFAPGSRYQSAPVSSPATPFFGRASTLSSHESGGLPQLMAPDDGKRLGGAPSTWSPSALRPVTLSALVGGDSRATGGESPPASPRRPSRPGPVLRFVSWIAEAEPDLFN